MGGRRGSALGPGRGKALAGGASTLLRAPRGPWYDPRPFSEGMVFDVPLT